MKFSLQTRPELKFSIFLVVPGGRLRKAQVEGGEEEKERNDF